VKVFSKPAQLDEYVKLLCALQRLERLEGLLAGADARRATYGLAPFSELRHATQRRPATRQYQPSHAVTLNWETAMSQRRSWRKPSLSYYDNA
jgi:hypothetical protein